MRNRRDIVNTVSALEQGAPGAVPEEWSGIEKLAGLYFKNSVPPYDEAQEERVVNRILSPAGKASFFRTLIVRPALILASFLAVFSLSLGIRRALYERSVEEKVGAVIALNTPAFDFVASNNMDKILQAALQENLNAKILDEEEVYEKVKASLWIYLSAQTAEEFMSRNREIIVPVIDRYSQEYVDYIKENSQNILI